MMPSAQVNTVAEDQQDVKSGGGLRFTTTDLYLSGFLLARGHQVTITPQGRGRHVFEFPGAAEEDAARYQHGASISAVVFADGIRRVKALIAGNTPHTSTHEASTHAQPRQR